MGKRWNWKEFGIDTLYYAGGSILYSLALYTFALHANFAPGGISGIAILINHFFRFPIGTLTLILNIPIFLVCFKTLGSKFVFKTVWAMLVNTFFLDVVFPFLPIYRGNALLASMFTGVFLGAGLAIIYMRGASTGGADLIILSVKKAKPHFSVGQISLAFDMLVILAGGLVFKNVDAVLYGIVSAFACTMTMDNVLYGAGSSKLALIITSKGQEVADAINVEVERGSTLVKAIGTYTGTERDMLYCACSKNEIYKVRSAAYAIDSDALVMVTEASEVTGEGFGLPSLPGNEAHAKDNNGSSSKE
ncbi:MAG: YitT family protein [Oscillospiraceae bacterium]